MRDLPVHEENTMLPVQQPRHLQERLRGSDLWLLCVQQAVGMREVQKRNHGNAYLSSLLRRMPGQEGREMRQVQRKLRANLCQATQITLTINRSYIILKRKLPYEYQFFASEGGEEDLFRSALRVLQGDQESQVLPMQLTSHRQQ